MTIFGIKAKGLRKPSNLFLMGIFLLFPLREAFSFSLGPQSFFRFADIFVFLSPLFLLLVKKTDARGSVSFWLAVFIGYAVLLGYICGKIVDQSYAFTFIVRAFATLLFIYVCEHASLSINTLMFDKFFKYVVTIEFIFCLMQLLGFNFFALHFSSYNPEKFFGVRRLSGTASEPGYLVPVLVPCLYYFFANRQNNLKYLVMVCFEFLFSFSSFAYAAFLLTLSYLALQTKEKLKKIFVPVVMLAIFFILLFIAVPQLYFVQQRIQEKIVSYVIEDESKMDWSAAERTENKKVATNAFDNLTIDEKIVGMGLGATKYFTERGVKYHFAGQEAGNAYLALLLNLGIAGLTLFFFVMYKVLKLKEQNVISNSLFCALIVQFIQYTITGNIWLYTLWFNVGLLIIVRKNYQCLSNANKR